MIDITGYSDQEIKRVITSVLSEYTTEIKSDDGERVICQSLFKNAIGFDTESTQILQKFPDMTTSKGKVIKGRTLVKECFCYSYQIAVGTKHYAIFRYLYQFLHFVENLVETVESINQAQNTNALCIIWVANLAHEWAFIKKRFCERFKVEKVFAKTERDALYIRVGCVEFRECIGLFGHSLADIAEKWTTTQKLKGDLDYNLIRHSETELTDFAPYITRYEYDKKKRLRPVYKYSEKQYCINDVIILTEMHAAVLQHYMQDNGAVVLPTTSSGFVRQKLKAAIRNNQRLTDLRESWNDKHSDKNQCNDNITLLKKFNRFKIDTEFQWLLCRNYSYSGGLCGSNIDYVGKVQTLKNSGGVICADITSDYPAQLNQMCFPSGRIHHVENGNYDEYKNRPFFVVLHISKMQSKNSHAVFSKHKICNAKGDLYSEYGTPHNIIEYNGKIWRAENVIAVWNDVDLKAYTEIYDMTYNIIDMWYFDRYAKVDKWLLDTMNDDYETKSKLKFDGVHKSPEFAHIYNDAKRDVNTYYGVLATRMHDLLNTLDADLNFAAEKQEKFTKTRWQFWLDPYLAFWTTSYARAIIIHFLALFGDCIIQYDTDSLYYIKNKGAELEKALIKYNEEKTAQNKRLFKKRENAALFETLGTWEFDEVYTQFLALGAKKYIKEDADGIHTVIAGLPKLAIPRETKEKKLKPFMHYNPVRQYIENADNKIVIEHIFAHKFASVYCDKPVKTYAEITDYKGKTINQELTTYHAIIPIDFTLSVATSFLLNIMNR